MTAPGRDWASQRERGSKALIRLMLWITLTLGWRAGTALLFPITGYFYLASPAARAASRDYLGRVLGRPATGADVLRHLFTFAAVIVDRVFLLSGRLCGFAIDVQGLDTLTAILGRGQGCVLLGAHAGSFDVLRAVGRDAPVAVRPLMYREHWGAMTPLLEALDPALTSAIIEIGRPDTMLRVQESLAKGEIVGILADRAPNERRFVAARFLGGGVFPRRPVRRRGAARGAGGGVPWRPHRPAPLSGPLRAVRRSACAETGDAAAGSGGRRRQVRRLPGNRLPCASLQLVQLLSFLGEAGPWHRR